jgi:hypothetical protein
MRNVQVKAFPRYLEEGGVAGKITGPAGAARYDKLAAR